MKATAAIELRPAADQQERKAQKQVRRQGTSHKQVGKFLRMNNQHAVIQVCRDLPTECWYG